MTGKYKDYNNFWVIAISVTAMILIFVVGFSISIISDNETGMAITSFLGFAALFLCLPLGQGRFNANENKIIFRIAFIKYEYDYSEIKSAKVQTGFIHGKYGSSPYVEIVITLNNGETAEFRDANVPDEAFSTPEKHKQFHDKHQFTKLSRYINDRAGGVK